jgi:tRNA threonylcarbamoyladenosine biosynthesis protein TsaE
VELQIKNLDEINTVAKEFVNALGNRTVVAFYGKMGVGKTTFIKAVCEELGVTDVINSPTFAIVNEYLSGEGQPVYHFDFYRIRRSEEVLDIGFYEYIDSGCLCLMEWPELIEDLLPEETVRVKITENADGTRTLTF